MTRTMIFQTTSELDSAGSRQWSIVVYEAGKGWRVRREHGVFTSYDRARAEASRLEAIEQTGAADDR